MTQHTSSLTKVQPSFCYALLVHHLTAEVLGLIGALRKLGCCDICTVFVGYNQDLAGVYRQAFNQISDDELRCYVLAQTNAESSKAMHSYCVNRHFMKQPATEPTRILDDLDAVMETERLDFLQAMRAIVLTVALRQMARTRVKSGRFLIIEDGGYASPVINVAALTNLSIQQFRFNYRCPSDPDTDANLPPLVASAVGEIMSGVIEHTRSGFDANMDVYRTHSRLFRPLFSIALSHLKTQIESSTVASTILTAIENILYSCGRSMNDRRVFVFGSRGNIGRRLMQQLQARVDEYRFGVIGCDLKVSRPESNERIPTWQYRSTQSSAGSASEVTKYADVDPSRTRDLDLIVGVTGGPTPGHPVLQVHDLIAWLNETGNDELFLVSGSTKTREYPEILSWLNEAFQSAGTGNAVVSLGNRSASVSKTELRDLLSGRDFGSRYDFTVSSDDKSE